LFCIINIMKNKKSKIDEKNTTKEELIIDADKVVEVVKKLIKEGNARRIIIQNEKGKTMLEVPITVGAIGAIILPVVAAVGALAALMTKCKIVILKDKD
jgi:hypothetical protein